jgi:catechol 2,3-dioxygenase-like lactoylglutathione lyase family enzyme
MSSVRIDRLDHLVLTVADIDATMDFYTRVLGMHAVTFGPGRTALTFGHSKINLHKAGAGRTHRRHWPHPQRLLPRPGPEPDRDQRLHLTQPMAATAPSRNCTEHDMTARAARRAERNGHKVKVIAGPGKAR